MLCSCAFFFFGLLVLVLIVVNGCRTGLEVVVVGSVYV